MEGRRRETLGGASGGVGASERLQSHLAPEWLEGVIVEHGWFNQAAPDNV